MKKYKVKIIATVILLTATVMATFSMRNDSTIMDEVSHLPAGYSYITQQDMRINPEHPPLLKDLAGISTWLWSKISGNQINIPKDDPAWTQEINSQWNFGFNFMYESGNNADAMLFWGRIPFLLLFLLLGFYVFRWSRELYGNTASLIATTLYAFSPTFLAHGRFVTTDLGAAAAFFISLYYFSKWLKNPNWKETVKTGLVFGLALMAKFSTFLLIPLFVFLVFVYVIAKKTDANFLKQALHYFGKLAALGIIGVVFIVTPIYQYHVVNYPVELQQRDMEHILQGHPMPWMANMVKWTADKPIVRAFGQYMFGFAMVYQRATGGNTTFFLGEVSNEGWRSYFPTVYLIKETLVFHILTLMALFFVLKKYLWHHIQNWKRRKEIQWFSLHRRWLIKIFPEFCMLSFIALYWYTSVGASNLNIGVRHVLPTFAFLYVLVSGQVAMWIKGVSCSGCFFSKPVFKKFLVGILLAWMVLSVISVYPSFLAYFNEAVGGPDNGYKYAVDSNLDWGQDLKRLKIWADKNNVDKIYIDYFGGSTAAYYFGDRALQWHGDWPREEMTEADYLALSLTFRQNDLGSPAPGFNKTTGAYAWLENLTPVAKIGHSIWVYKLK